ncbi:MAG: triose-phosphate isomerase [Acidimicrobiia bacterium]|nr:triose-phosphate isomerase [Acidimicrobiia bacterium]
MADSRTPLISGNWKMHHNHFEAIQCVQKLGYLLKDLLREEPPSVVVSVHPPFTDIRSVQTTIESDRIALALGAQNCHPDEKGAFTGEVSATMLAKLNVDYVIVGHSERRELFGETDEFVNAKVHAVLKAEMTPILCVGETLAEREEGRTGDKVAGQVRAGLKGLKAEQVGELVIAYEPIWAIGTGKTATTEDAQSVCGEHVRAVVAAEFGDEAAATVRVQYGGSVKPGNIAELMAQPDIDGALVGGASLDPDDFAAIARYQEQ